MNSFDHDPVQDFFNRERDQIVSQDGNDVHWQSIVRQARVQRRSKILGYAAGVAAAGLVIGAVAYGTILRDGKEPLTPATNGNSSVLSAPRPIASGEPTPGKTSSTTLPTELPVPKSFTALSVTNVGSGSLFVLGSGNCGSGRCPVLIGSRDSGRSWHLVHAFQFNPLPPGSTREGAVQATNVLSQVRFANPMVGWVFGGDVQYTKDGGKTFRTYGHPGESVIDVETGGGQVIMTTADGCKNTVCTGARHVARADIAADGATEVGSAATGGELGDLQVVWDGKAPFVTPRWKSAPPKGFAPARITASGLEPLGSLVGSTSPTGTCANVSEQDVIATSDPQGGLFAFCAAAGGGAAGSLGMAVFNSTDQGKAWAQVSSAALVLVNSSSRSFAAASATALLAVSGGNPDTHGSMQVSHDGGKSWHGPSSPPPTPTNGWEWVGAPGTKTFYAVSGDATPAFWKSDDSGETWTRVDLTS